MTAATVRAASLPAAHPPQAKVLAVAAAFIGLAAGLPSSFGSTSTAFIVPLTREFGWGRTIPSLMYTMSMIGTVIASVWLGRVIERFGAGMVAVVSGTCLMAVVLGLAAQSGSPAVALTLAFLAGLLGAGTGVGLYLSALPRWFDRDLGRALGLAIIGQSAGLTLMPTLASVVMATHGWRAAYAALAGAQIALTLVAAAMLLGLRRIARAHPRDAARAAAEEGIDLATALRGRTFWLLAAMIFLVTLGVFGGAIHLFPLYIDRGIAPARLPLLAVALGMGTLVGRIGSGFLLDLFEAKLIAFATFAIGAIGIAALALSTDVQHPASLYLPPLLVGAALGAESDILAYMARRFFGLRHYSAIYNRALIGYYAGAVTGPLALGWAFDHLREPRWAIAVLSVSCVAAMAVSQALPSTRRPDAG